jgi:hypothetical protein
MSLQINAPSKPKIFAPNEADAAVRSDRGAEVVAQPRPTSLLEKRVATTRGR